MLNQFIHSQESSDRKKNDALNNFLQNILVSQKVPDKETSQHRVPLMLSDNAPVIKELPSRVYKGII